MTCSRRTAGASAESGSTSSAREQSHPEDAIPIYEREVESLIGEKKDAGYRDAVKMMVRIESLLLDLERPDAFVSSQAPVSRGARERGFVSAAGGVRR
jgi:uncharacterized Zn finger protein